MAELKDILAPLCQGWMGKIEEAIRSRKGFDEVAEQCNAFFSESCGFMWDQKYQKKYMQGTISPRFKITLQKAFELVALYGPSLYWRNPKRKCHTREQIPLTPDLFGDQNDPFAQQIFQQISMQENERATAKRMSAWLNENWLNYTPNEQPGGGLSEHAELAITEALVTGRGTLWSEWYQMPGSSQKITASVYDSNKNLLIDPDAEIFDDAYWIARRRVQPYWEVERRFERPAGSLRAYAAKESLNAQGAAMGDDLQNYHRAEGKTQDLIVYYEIYSRAGVGTRMTNMETPLKEALDRAVGDYAYIVVAPGVPFPLNAPVEVIADDSTYDDDVFDMFSWPAPFWMDRRWPVCVLDFYRKPRGVWPIAPMAPGLGELTFLNTMIAHLANRVWSSSRDFIAVAKSACKDLEQHLKKGDDLSVIPIDDIHQDINKVVSFLQQPQISFDVWKIIDAVTQLFEKRTGMNALLYSMNPGDVQSRSAADINAKEKYLQVRPDYMAGRVEKWMTEAARNEKILTRWVITAEDVQPLFGPAGAMMWRKYITGQPPEQVLREVDVTLEAGSMRKPNQERDIANMNQIFGYLAPELSKHADATGDTGPLNNFIDRWGKTMEMDMTGLQMGQRVPMPPPPPPPEVQQQMQQQAQMQQAMMQADLQGKQLDVQGKGIDLQIKMAEAQGKGLETQKRQLELQFDAVDRQQQMQFDATKFGQDMQFDQLRFGQEMEQDKKQFLQDLLQKRAESELKIRTQEAQAKVAARSAAAKARSKPSSA